MNKLSLCLASVMMAFSATAAPLADKKDCAKDALSHKLFRYAPKAKADGRGFGATSFDGVSAQRHGKGAFPVKAASQDFIINSLPTADLHGILDSPKGEAWYYTMDYNKVVVDHGAWKETLINGYKVTVYDAAYNVIGTVEDEVELREDETKVAQVEVGTLVTQKFFNYDTSYEIMVSIACNTVNYVNTYRTNVYTLGNNTPIANFDGYYVSAVNTARDAWSEKYWITFLTEEDTETPLVGNVTNVYDNVFKTYKSAGYSGMEEPVLTVRVPGLTMSGENSIPFVSTEHDGQPYFMVNHLKYSWFEDPFDYSNDNPTADNELICDVYTTPSAWGSTVELYSTTTIPSDATKENSYFLYCGSFSLDGDVSFDRYTSDGTPSLIITRENFVPGQDGYTYNYYVYSTAPKGETADGKKILDLAPDAVSGGYFMNDIAGFDPQVMFVKVSADGSYSFDFVNLKTGVKELSLAAELGNGVYITTETDRVATPDGYMLVCPQTYGESDDDGNMFTSVAYVNTDGTINHIDRLNLGKDIDLAQVYSEASAYNPYIFNIDDAREYLVLVKRRNVPGQTGNHEELLVVSSDPAKGFLLQLTPDEEMGALRYIALLNLGTDNAALMVIYSDGEKMHNTNYKLPLNLFDEGDGTAANPYVITTVGGLQQIKANPAAHYILGCDIDATGAEINHSSAFTFSGTLDGCNHVISNLKVTGYPLLPNITGDNAAEGNQTAAVENICFVNPVFTAGGTSQGLLAANTSGTKISNVHVYGGKVSSDVSVAGLVGKASLYTVISECSFDGEVICNGDESAAGIVEVLQTSSKINACAVTGVIKGGSVIGGIAASTHSNAGTVSNCHVNAAITGENTIGGIVGESQRSPIVNCHVEGTIEATAAPRWGGGPKVGGIVGELSPEISNPDESEEGEEPVVKPTVIKGCYVNLASMTFTGEKGEETYSGQNDTMHRIVGKSRVNEEPEVIDYDSEWNPIYGDPMAPEERIADNYAVATLAKVAEGIADDAATTEGKSVEKDETGLGFFMELGWAYGFDAENPWAMAGDYTCPSLYFEGGMLTVTPAETVIGVGDEVTVELSMVGNEITEDMIEGFTYDISDETVVEPGDMSFENGKISVVCVALKEGQATMTFGLNGKTVKAVVIVNDELASIDNVAGSNVAIRINGRTVTAEGCTLNVYSTTGSLMMKANGTANLGTLSAGVYLITAKTADGKISTVKVALK